MTEFQTIESNSTRPREDVVAIIPAYQCAVTIGEVVEATLRHVSRVVVVNDGSTDGTAAAAAAAGAEVVTNEVNRGKGNALRRGFDHLIGEPDALGGTIAPIEAVALLDGDGQHDPDDLPVLLAAWDEGHYGLIVGGRLTARESIPPHRYWTNTIGTKLLSWVTGVTLEDSQSGYRVLSMDLLRRMDLRSDGYAIESEMLIKAARRRARIGQVVIRTIYHDRVPSFYRPVRDTVYITLASAYHRLFDRVR